MSEKQEAVVFHCWFFLVLTQRYIFKLD